MTSLIGQNDYFFFKNDSNPHQAIITNGLVSDFNQKQYQILNDNFENSRKNKSQLQHQYNQYLEFTNIRGFNPNHTINNKDSVERSSKSNQLQESHSYHYGSIGYPSSQTNFYHHPFPLDRSSTFISPMNQNNNNNNNNQLINYNNKCYTNRDVILPNMEYPNDIHHPYYIGDDPMYQTTIIAPNMRSFDKNTNNVDVIKKNINNFNDNNDNNDDNKDTNNMDCSKAFSFMESFGDKKFYDSNITQENPMMKCNESNMISNSFFNTLTNQHSNFGNKNPTNVLDEYDKKAARWRFVEDDKHIMYYENNKPKTEDIKIKKRTIAKECRVRKKKQFRCLDELIREQEKQIDEEKLKTIRLLEFARLIDDTNNKLPYSTNYNQMWYNETISNKNLTFDEFSNRQINIEQSSHDSTTGTACMVSNYPNINKNSSENLLFGENGTILSSFDWEHHTYRQINDPKISPKNQLKYETNGDHDDKN